MTIMSTILHSDLLHGDRLRRLVPPTLKSFLKRRIPYADYRSEQLRREAEERLGGPIPFESDYDSPYQPVLGILFDNSYTFALNVAACRDLRVRYKVIDFMASDWVSRVADSGCDAFLATPSTRRRIWRHVYEERLWVIAHDLKVRLCPSYDELYLWESKRRMHDWLVAYNIPHPDTWVFLNREQAMDFCRDAELPLVAKTDSGAASSGIFVLRDRRSAEMIVRKAFGAGLVTRSADAREREEGVIFFQRFVPHDYEWRIVRIGDDYICRKKVRIGDCASGSGDIGWAAPLPGMLDFARMVTDTAGFRHMAVDVFENPDRNAESALLVNEMQAIVGFRDVPENSNTGRWRLDERASSWAFDAGRFHQNECANLRVRMLLNAIDEGWT